MNNVIHIPFETIPYSSPAHILRREVQKKIEAWTVDGEMVALKLHFGEQGSTRFIRPLYLREIALAVKNLGGLPFCTDTVVLYPGMRSKAPSHIELAASHGYNYSTLNCPVIIADGLCGHDAVTVDYDGKRLKNIPVASAIAEAPFLIVATHVTLHGFSGLGSTVKNLGMGCVSEKGKIAIHQALCPKTNPDKCVQCGACVKRCRFGAIKLNPTIEINLEKCNGCGHCCGVCRSDVFEYYEEQYTDFCERLVDAALAVVKDKHVLYVNFLTEITKQCDCASFTHPSICRDLGILISDSLYAVEKATFDLLDAETGFAANDERPANMIRQILERGDTRNSEYELQVVRQ